MSTEEKALENANIFPPQDTWTSIYTMLHRGSTVELKLVGGRIDIVEIKRTVKYKLTLPTGEADG